MSCNRLLLSVLINWKMASFYGNITVNLGRGMMKLFWPNDFVDRSGSVSFLLRAN